MKFLSLSILILISSSSILSSEKTKIAKPTLIQKIATAGTFLAKLAAASVTSVETSPRVAVYPPRGEAGTTAAGGGRGRGSGGILGLAAGRGRGRGSLLSSVAAPSTTTAPAAVSLRTTTATRPNPAAAAVVDESSYDYHYGGGGDDTF